MRKLFVLLPLLLLPLVTQAHKADSHQPPIIALSNNKLYAVSPVDGSATVLVEPPDGESLFMNNFGYLSPDGTHMVYATATDPESMGGLVVRVYLLSLATGESTSFVPSGGVFDVQPRPPNTIRLDYPTWSVDGSRLYYLRSEVNGREYGKMVNVQLAYFDFATQTHKLVARLDPTEYVLNLMAVEAGIIVNVFTGLGQPAQLTFYGLDNRLISEAEIADIYPFALRYDDFAPHDYYAVGAPDGGIAILWRVEEPTVGQRSSEAAFYPASRSRSAGARSLHIFRVIQDSGESYRIYNPHNNAIIAQLAIVSGVNHAISPDGQSIAYLHNQNGWNAPIRIIDSHAEVRELAFVAEEIWWGAEEHVALYAGDFIVHLEEEVLH